tara:strand:- start:122 stop:802 length:681 start_codon:yes stop_codon:yes gene_type:complete
MAVSAGPSVIDDGLVFCLDAANELSYAGEGTSWVDLVGENNSVLTNGPTFDDDNAGSIVFDGANDYANFSVSGLTTTATIEMYCKIGAAYSGKMFFGFYRYDIYCYGGAIGFNTARGDTHGISSSTASSIGVVDTWRHYVFEMRSDVSYTNNKIYIDGELQSLSQVSGSEGAASRNFNDGDGRIAMWLSSGGYYMPMNLSIFKIYNKALTQQQIKQNYKALRGRFN